MTAALQVGAYLSTFLARNIGAIRESRTGTENQRGSMPGPWEVTLGLGVGDNAQLICVRSHDLGYPNKWYRSLKTNNTKLFARTSPRHHNSSCLVFHQQCYHFTHKYVWSFMAMLTDF